MYLRFLAGLAVLPSRVTVPVLSRVWTNAVAVVVDIALTFGDLTLTVC